VKLRLCLHPQFGLINRALTQSSVLNCCLQSLEGAAASVLLSCRGCDLSRNWKHQLPFFRIWGCGGFCFS